MNLESSNIDEIKICRNEDAKYGEDDYYNKRLNLKITTWMKLYANLDTPESRASMRDVSTSIAETFFGEVVMNEQGDFLSKFDASAPYYFFLTTVSESEGTYNQPYSVTLHEIMDYTTGDIIESIHMSSMVDMLWLTTQYMIAGQVPNMTIVYEKLLDPENQYIMPFNIELAHVEMPEFGCFNTKMSILKYRDNKIRIIISTANLLADDWQIRTEGLWISPFLPLLRESAKASEGESPTNFKKDFIKFLQSFKQPEIFGWEALIHRTDFSDVDVFFIASVPGYHEGDHLNSWGHKKLSTILSKHVTLPSDSNRNWPVVILSPIIESYDKSYHDWLLQNLVDAMTKKKDKRIVSTSDFKFIHPSNNNWKQSFDNTCIGEAPSCLLNNKEKHLEESRIKNHLYRWKANKINRTMAFPHIKCYTRISEDETKIAWFVLTSTNATKSGWGNMCNEQCHITNYEAGVVFIPKFIIRQTTFPIKESKFSVIPLFLLPYDLPLTPYKPDDEPLVTDYIELNSYVTQQQSNKVKIPKEEEEEEKAYEEVLSKFYERLKFYDKLEISDLEEKSNSAILDEIENSDEAMETEEQSDKNNGVNE